MKIPAMNWLNKNRIKKALPLFTVYFLASTLSVALGMGGLWQRIVGRPVVKATVGYPNFVDPSDYGTPGATITEVGTASADGSVQNLQAPTISGFSSDLFTGGATVSYPLALPPGRGGLTPSLSLNYSSNSVYGPMLGRDANGSGKHNEYDIVPGETDVDGNLRQNWTEQLFTQSSQIGLGWNLGGLGSVFRDFNNRYTLVLNGQSYRLFKSLGADGEWDWEAGEWHTDPTSFLKIEHPIDELFNDEPKPGETVPENFKITDTNGTTYTFEPHGYFWKRCDYRDFGCKADDPTKPEKWASFYNKWVLTKVKDVHGNEISISYNIEDQVYIDPGYVTYPRAINPSTIEYSGSGSNFSTVVEFVTASREDWKYLEHAPDPKSDGAPKDASNQFFFSTKRLERVNVKVKQGADWKIVRQYVLENNDYFTHPAHTDIKLHPKLNAITARGRDGAEALPPYTFEYDPVHNAGLGNITNYRILTKASNGYGGSVGYAYEDYNVMDYDPKTGDWVTQGSVFGLHRVTEKTADDGRGNSFKTTFEYPEHTVGISDDAFHSGFESVGHNLVTAAVYAKNGGSKIRETKYYFIQGEMDGVNFYVSPERGRLWKSETYDGLGTLLSSSETDYLRDPDDKGGTQNDIWNTPHFIAAKETRACAEPNSDYPLGSKTTYTYDPSDQGDQQWGNLTNTLQYEVPDCDFANASPYRATHNTYAPNLDKHITNRVTETETIAYPSAERLTLGWNSYNDLGLLTLSRAFYNFPESASSDPSADDYDTVDSAFGYDDFGNLTTTTTYEGYNQSGDTRTSTIEYENTYNTFPVSATNTLRHTTATRYYNSAGEEVFHPALAKKTVAVDINGQEWTTIVDGMGRVTSTLVPGEGDTPQTIVAYYDDNDPFMVHTQTRDDHEDADGDGVLDLSYHNSWQFYNGLGQVIESQSELEGDGTKITVAASEYNALGQPIKTLLPYAVSVAPEDIGNLKFEPTSDWDNRTRSEADYDSLGRVIEARTPTKDGGWYTAKSGYYGRKTAVLDPKSHLATTEVDNLGRTVSTRVFEGARGLGTPEDYYTETTLVYDHLDRVKKTTTTDLAGTVSAVSEVFYNQFGQQTSVIDPDLGTWSYTYDPVGTLATTTDAKGQVTELKYDDLNRVFEKYFGSTLATSFRYDDCQKGQLCSDATHNQDINTSTAYNYDEKGRLVSEIKSIDNTSYTTRFTYDAASRQQTITYPDSTSETVTYSYNDAGLLNSVASPQQTYLASAKYNVLGMATEEVLGSGVVNTYDYEPNTFRLAEKSVKKGDDTPLWSQNLDYDPVGNIEEITYPLRKSLSFPDLPFKIDYAYDDLNRLTGGQMAGLTDEAAKEVFYTDYKYDQLGRMTSKTEEGETEQCNKKVIYDVDTETMLRADNLSEEERAFITFMFYDNNGESLFFIGDWAEPVNDSHGIGERSYVPIRVDFLSDIRSDYPDYEGYVVVESHDGADYPGSADGPCIEVTSGTVAEICPSCPQAFLAGDLDCNCDVDIGDIMRVAVIWNTKEGDARFKPGYDFDSDGDIDIVDIMMVASKWNDKCEE